MGIIQKSIRKKTIQIKSGLMSTIYFPDTTPNIFQIRNNSTNPVYLSDSANVTDTNYDMMVVAGGTRVLTNPQGLKNLYAYATSDSTIVVNSYESTEMFASDLDQVQISQIINSVVSSAVNINTGTNHIGKVEVDTPLPAGTNHIGKVEVDTPIILPQFKAFFFTLPAGSNYTLKPTAGYLAKVKSSLNDITIFNGSTSCWYIGSDQKVDFNTPIYCDQGIKLLSATGGTVYVVYA